MSKERLMLRGKRLLSFMMAVMLAFTMLPAMAAPAAGAEMVSVVEWRPSSTVSQSSSLKSYDATGGLNASGATLTSSVNAGFGTADEGTIWTGGWNNPDQLNYWQIDFSTIGFENLTLGLSGYSTAAGPKNWEIQYAVGSDIVDGTYIKISDSDYSVATSYQSIIKIKDQNDFTLPSAMNDQSSVSIRFIMRDKERASGAEGVPSGNNRIGIIIKGDRLAGTVAAPTATTAAGNIAYGASVELTQSDNKDIYYTISTTGADPADPTQSGVVYDGLTPFTITQDTKIWAAAKDGSDWSGITKLNYTPTIAAPKVASGPPSRVNAKSETVIFSGEELTLDCENTHADIKIRYTTDGTNPTASTGIEYTSGSNIALLGSEGSTTVKAVAYGENGIISDVSSFDYTIGDYKYVPVTEIEDGGTYILAATQKGVTYALNARLASNWLPSAIVVPDGTGAIPAVQDSAQLWKLDKVANGVYSIQALNGTGINYLAHAASDATSNYNYPYSKDEVDDTAEWSVGSSDNDTFTFGYLSNRNGVLTQDVQYYFALNCNGGSFDGQSNTPNLFRAQRTDTLISSPDNYNYKFTLYKLDDGTSPDRFEKPDIAPAGGAVTGTTQVSISVPDDSTVYYTTGTDEVPTTWPGTWIEYTTPFDVTPTAGNPVTVRAVAVDAGAGGKLDSAVASETYTLVTVTSIADVRTATSGSFTIEGVATVRMDNNNMFVQDASGGILVYSANAGATVGNKVRVSGTWGTYGGQPQLTSATYTDLGTPAAGEQITPEEVTLETLSENTSSSGPYQGKLVKISGAEIATIGSGSGALRTHRIKQGSYELPLRAPALTGFEVGEIVDVICIVGYFNDIQLQTAPLGNITKVVMNVDPVLASPNGGAVVGGNVVSLTCATEGATIHYEVNGGAEQTSSSPAQVALNEFNQTGGTATIRAWAEKDSDSSIVRTYTYTQRKVEMPTASPASGEISDTDPSTVTLAAAEEDKSGLTNYKIYYTTDGSAPDTSSAQYSAPIPIAALPFTIKAIAVANGCINSDEAVFTYTAPIDFETDGDGLVFGFDFYTVVAGDNSSDRALSTTKTGEKGSSSSVVFMKGASSTEPAFKSAGASMSGLAYAAGVEHYWFFQTSSEGFSNLSFSGQMRSTAAGPRNFKGQFSTNGTDWVDIPDSSFVAGSRTVSGSSTYYNAAPFSFDLPSTASNQSTLYIRLLITDSQRRNDDAINSAYSGDNQIQEIRLTGNYILGANQVASVTASPAPGDVFPGTEVALSSLTEEAEIYVSDDGSTGWTQTSSVIIPAGGKTFYAKATKETMTESRVKQFVFTEKKLPGVKVNKSTGPVIANTEVVLTHEDEDVTIYYTLTKKAGVAGEEVPGAKTPYTEPIILLEDWFPVELEAIAEKEINSQTASSDIASRRYTLRQSLGDAQNYFGQLHAHTSDSDGAGTLTEAFNYAENVAGVDFLAITDHSNSYDTAPAGDGLSDLNLKTYNANNAVYKAGRDLTASINSSRDPEGFVALYGYEMTWSGGPGHINTINTTGFVSRNNTALNNKSSGAGMKAYYELLKADDQLAVSQFNHPGTTFGNFLNYAFYDPEIDTKMTLLEVGNGEGAIESSGYFPSYEEYNLALDKGWHVAPTNNQDNHKGKWGNSNTARSVVYTDDYSHDGIMLAMQERRVYATEDEDLDITYLVDGMPLGTIFQDSAEGDVNFSITAADPQGAPARVEIITNGGRVFKQWGGTGGEALGLDAENDFSKTYTTSDVPDGYYYVRVTMADGRIAVTAPVWFGKATLLGITALSTTTVMPVTKEALPLTLTMFNNETYDATIEAIRFTANGKSITGPVLGTDNRTIDANGGERILTLSYTPTTVGPLTIHCEVDVSINGASTTCSYDLTLNVSDANKLVYIGIDGSHYNEYVTGNYKDNMTNFANLAAMYNVRVNVLNTSAELIAALSNPQYKMFIFTAPTRRLDPSATNPATGTVYGPHRSYTDAEVNAVAAFAARGGTVIVTGWSNLYESYAYVEETTLTMAAEQNKLLDAIGSSMRISSDSAWKGGTQISTSSSVTSQAQRFYLEAINLSSPWMAGVIPANTLEPSIYSNNEQKFSAYGASTVYVTDMEDVVPLVYNDETTISVDFDLPTPAEKNPQPPKYTYDGDGTERFLNTAAQTVTHAGGKISTVIASGGAFMSNFEILGDLDNWESLTYSNYNFLENIIASIAGQSTIAQVWSAPEGSTIVAEGIVTSNVYGGTNPNTGFFDCIYIQDDTRGINLFPVSSGVEIGQRIRIVGTVSSYQGEKQIQVTRLVVLDRTLSPKTPEQLSTKATTLSANTGKLVKTIGKITDIVGESGDTMQLTVDDGTGGTRVYMNAYITPAVDLSGLEVGDYVTVTGLASYGENMSGGNMLPRIRVRDRNEIIEFNGNVLEFISNGGTSIQSIYSDSAITVDSAPKSTKSGYTFDGWYTDSDLTVPVSYPYNPTDSIMVLYAKWSRNLTTETPPVEPDKPSIIVDGKPVDAGTVTTEGGTTTVAVNQETLNKQLEEATEKQVTISIPKSEDTSKSVAELVVKNVEDMAVKDVNLTVQVGDVAYNMPASAVDTNAILETLGAENSEDVVFSITITSTMNEETQAIIDEAVSESGAEVVFPPVEFTMTATYGGQTYDVNDFSQYVTRSVEITAEQAARVTTAIVVDADGTIRHVPTRVYEKDGKWYAEISSLTNSVYILVENTVKFKDAEGKWYEDAVNEMGSRMVVNGVGNGNYAGDNYMSRAEFAAIVVRMLGLAAAGNGGVFTDVTPDKWYYGAIGTAYSRGLVNGIGGNLFGPNGNITREQAMQLMCNAAKLAGFKGDTASIDDFSDAGNVSEWASDAVKWSVGSALVVGSNGKLNPQESITRGEVATLILRFLQQAELI